MRKTEKHLWQLILILFLGAVSVLALVAEIDLSVRRFSEESVLGIIASGLLFLLLFYYAVWGYRVSHGNLMKYLFLAFSLCCLVGILSADEADFANSVILYAYSFTCGIMIMLSAFIAGRLNQFKKNVWLVLIGALLMAASSAVVVPATDSPAFLEIVRCFALFILWVDLVVAYVLRFRAHREAGLSEPKEE